MADTNKSSILVYDLQDLEDEGNQNEQTLPDTATQNASSTNVIYVRKKPPSERPESQSDQYNIQSPAKLVQRKRPKKGFLFEESDSEKEEKDQNVKVSESTKGGKTIEEPEDLEEYQLERKIPPKKEFQFQIKQTRRVRQMFEEEEMAEKIQEKIEESEEQESYEESEDEQDVQTSGVPVALFKSDINKLIKMVIPPGFQIICFIKVQKLFLGLKSVYNLYLKENQNVILSAKNQFMSFVSNYNISKSKENHSKRHKLFVCNLRSNFSGTEWKVHEDQEEKIRITYEETVLGYKSTRVMNVVKVDPQSKVTKKVSLQKMLNRPKQKQKNLIKFQTKQPKLVKGKYQLDFHGHVKMASGKNFILQYQEKGLKKQCLILAKQKQQMFVMEVRYPLTILEGFGICLTSLDGKILVN